jgi:hypothetical protein
MDSAGLNGTTDGEVLFGGNTGSGNTIGGEHVYSQLDGDISTLTSTPWSTDGASDDAAFRADFSSVPDGGSTAAMLTGGLCLFGMIRRRWRN